MNKVAILLLFAFLISCEQENKTAFNARTIKVVEGKGYIVPKDSIGVPPVIPIDESKLIKIPAGKPTIKATNLNIHLIGKPKVVLAGKPKVCTPGKDTFLLPKSIQAIDSPFYAGIPKTVIAKDMIIKDPNPYSFTIFTELQGLKHGPVRCMLQDKIGNIWFATEGGVSKYNGLTFSHYTVKEGLNDNVIHPMLEDKSGNLWFSTMNGGLSKYDGKTFTHYTDREGLSNNRVFSMLEDKKGNLWFGTEGGGVNKYDGKSFTHFTEKEGLSNNVVMGIQEDKSGNLWFGTLGGVSKYDGKSFTHFTEKEGLSNDRVLSVLKDKSGNLWFGTDGGGVNMYNGISFTHFTEKEGLSDNHVCSILQDKSGNLWFGTNPGGVSKYDGKTFMHFTEKEGLSSKGVLSALEDKSGNLWFGMDGGGVNKYNGKIFTHFTEKEGLSNNAVSSVLEDRSGNLWIGTLSGGVCKYNGETFTHFTEKEGLSNNNVSCILEDKSGNLWFGSELAGVSKYDGKTFTHYTQKDGLISNSIFSILEDKSGNIWFGSQREGLSKYNGKSFTNFTVKEGLTNNLIWSIVEDKNGILWFGTGGGVTKYDGRTFTHFTKKEGLIHNGVVSIFEDKNGNLWFGTLGGVSKYDGKKFTHFTENEGLCNNHIYNIIEDKSGNLWFGGRVGLSKLSPKKLSELNDKIRLNSINGADIFFKNYFYEDGFLGVGCFRNSMYEDKKGTIWIGTKDRLTAIHPENMQTDSVAPNIQLNSIELFNENIAWGNLQTQKDSAFTLENGVKVANYSFDGLTNWYSLPENLSLAYDNNYLTFDFIGITMNDPQSVKYQYILEGLDKNWRAITNQSKASYGNLPNNSYTFKVKAMNSEGYWSKPFEYTFTIRPPWWKTWWAYSLYLIIFGGSIRMYISFRVQSLKAKQKELKQKVEDATLVIRNQKIEVEIQKDAVEQQKLIIETKNQKILDSIQYAKRIQSAILPPSRVVKIFLKDSFILYLPKDIVAGDFYWMENINDIIYVAACDCTGHGVPGALVSVVCNNALNRAVNEFGKRLPGEIFDKTRELILENFANSDEEVLDGMDASLAALDLNNRTLLWSGAYNPLWIIQKDLTTNEPILTEIKADKQPVGNWYKTKPFTTHPIQLNEGDIIYLFTDGYADQFGGEKNQKMTKTKFRQFLLSIANLPMEKQRTALLDFHNQYRGNGKQVDDICLIGIRV